MRIVNLDESVKEVILKMSLAIMDQVELAGMKNLARAGLWFRMAGHVIPFVRLLRHLLQISSKAMISEEDDQEIKKIVSFLECVHIILSDFDVSHDFAFFGGHQVIKRLSLSSHDAISMVATDMIGVILSCQGIAFPMATVLDVDTNPTPDEAPSKLPNFYSFPINRDDTKSEGKELSDEAKELEYARIIIRSVPGSTCGIGQQSVGHYLWPSATILSRYLCRSPCLVEGKSVLEIGAGVGMLGLVCARLHATSVCLTDVFQPILDNLYMNVQLNRSDFESLFQDTPNLSEPAAIPQDCDVSVKSLDWYKIGNQTRSDALDEKQKFDLIVGSDLICSVQCAYGVVDSIHNYLSMDGIAVIVNPIEKHRWGVDKLLPSLKNKEGIFFKSKIFWHSACTLDNSIVGTFVANADAKPLDWLFEEYENEDTDPIECMAYYFILVAKNEDVLQYYTEKTIDIWRFGDISLG